jgi:tetratricopeptide (TPR) repeat protein
MANDELSLKGVALVFIKRENGKVFGPFQTEKVKILVSQGKLKPTELISQNKNKWHEIKTIKEFKNQFGNNKIEDEELLPGLKSELPGLKSELPGLKSELPGLKSELPGLKSELPGLKSELPGLKSELPGFKIKSPGVKSDLPGIQSNFPGVKSDLPGIQSNFPGVKSDLPGIVTSLPGVDTTPSPISTSTNSDAIITSPPPVFKESDINVSESNMDDPIEIDNGYSSPSSPSPVFTTSNDKISAISLSSDEGINLNPEIDLDIGTGSGNLLESPSMDLDSMYSETDFQSKEGDQTKENSNSLKMKQDLPDFISNIEKTKIKRSVSSKNIKDKSNNIILLGVLMILVLTVLAGDWTFGFIGLFGKSKKITKKYKSANRSNYKNRITKRGKDFKISLSLDYIGLKNIISDKKSKKIYLKCESALLLAFHFNEFNFESCSKIFKNKLIYNSNEKINKINVLRLLILSGNFSSLVKTIVGEKGIKQPEKIAEKIISKSLAKDRRSSLWNMFNGFLAFSKKEYTKAQSSFLLAKTQEPNSYLGINFYLSMCNNKSGKKLLMESKDYKLWGSLGEGLSLFLPLVKTGGVIGLKLHKIPSFEKIDKKSMNKLGPKYSSILYAFNAYNSWIKGDFNKAYNYCQKSISINSIDDVSSSICTQIWVYHGFLRKKITIDDNFKPRWKLFSDIMHYLGYNRNVKGTALLIDLKKNKNTLYDIMGPWNVGFNKAKVDIKNINNIIKLSLEKEPVLSSLSILSSAWLFPNLSKIYRDILFDFKKNKNLDKLENIIEIEQLGNLLDLIYLSHEGKWKDYIKAYEKVKVLHKGILIPFSALYTYAKFLIIKGNSKKLIEKFSKIEILDPRELYVLLKLYVSKDDIAKGYKNINKINKLTVDLLFFKGSTGFYLKGKQKNRLLKGLKFINKTLKLNKDDSDANFLTGQILLESGKFVQGETYLKKLLISNKLKINNLFEWVNLEIKLGRTANALNALNAGLKIFKKTPGLLLKISEIYLVRKNYKNSLKYLNKIKTEKIGAGKKYLIEGKCYKALRNNKKALLAFSNALKYLPDNPEINFLYGKNLILNNKIKKSVIYLEKSIILIEKINKKLEIKVNFKFLNENYKLLAGVYWNLKKRKNAIKNMKKYIEMTPPGILRDDALKQLRYWGGD